jgi:hypothetical protein
MKLEGSSFTRVAGNVSVYEAVFFCLGDLVEVAATGASPTGTPHCVKSDWRLRQMRVAPTLRTV